jgi:antitoxin YefM
VRTLSISGLQCASLRREKFLDFSSIGQYPVHVKSITYTAARENLASTINRVCEDHAPVVITRNRDQAVVMLSLDEYESLQETAYLLRSPANAKRLLASLDAVKRGKLIRKKLKLNA